MVSVHGYQIENKIYQNSRRVYYRAIRDETGEKVIIKSHPSTNPDLKDILQFNHEYDLLKNLNISGVIQPEAIVKHANGTALVIKEFDANPLTQILRKEKLEVVEALKIALSLARTIDEFHKHNIIHRDVQPENIFVGAKKKETWIVDCSVSSFLPKEMPGIRNVGSVDGNLAYISPEQTGRTNRKVDYRTDFYSFGITLYEMLTGQVPFKSVDALELVHSHLVKKPLPPHEIVPTIPPVISDIVLKLLSKTIEERYKSAWGLMADLQECQRQFEELNTVERFRLGHKDVSDKLQLSEKLYGREPEIETLLKVFEEVSQGGTEIVMVSGYSGVGKTSVVKELYRPISRTKGYFVSGKHDQFQWKIPYSALVFALKELIRQILTESDEQLNRWKEKLLRKLGKNGQIIIDIIPDVELLIGPQKPAEELAPVESRNRFNFVFRNFIRVFSDAEHPLVIFLDDLQWADTATVDLIPEMVESYETQKLLFIGAYRDNEVNSHHPLRKALDILTDTGRCLHHIRLKPLNPKDIVRLIADTLEKEYASIKPLADVVYQKTNGNPFFVRQFIDIIHYQKLLAFNMKERTWQWDVDAIQDLGEMENVIDLLVMRLQRLAPDTQNVLKIAAYVGETFNLQTLGNITGQATDQLLQNLLPALHDKMIVPASQDLSGNEKSLNKADEILEFRFLHDRVQQAAYSLTYEAERKQLHLQIGRLWLSEVSGGIHSENIFQVVHHLNHATELIDSQAEKYHLSELNLKACRKAKLSAAFKQAYDYARIGIKLLAPDSWTDKYALSLSLYSEALETAYPYADIEEIDRLFARVKKNALTPLDMAGPFTNTIRIHMVQNRIEKAIELGLEILSLLGVELDEHTTTMKVKTLQAEILSNLPKEKIAELIGLPRMANPEKAAILRLLVETAVPAFWVGSNIFSLAILKGVTLSIEHGNTADSCVLYSAYGLYLCSVLNEFDLGYAFGNLAINLAEQMEAQKHKCKVIEIFNIHIRHYKEHLRETIDALLQSYQIGVENGDLQFAGFCGYCHCMHRYFAGDSLESVSNKMIEFNRLLRKHGQLSSFYLHSVFQQAVSNLSGQVANPCMLKGDAYDESKLVPIHQKANDRHMLNYFYLNKMILCYLFEDFDAAAENASLAGQYLDGVIGVVVVPIFYFYDSLIQLAQSYHAGRGKQKTLNAVLQNQERLKIWSDSAPMNYAHKYHLVEAERLRASGEAMQAIDHYEQAVALARENGYLNIEALANELTAKFWLTQNKHELAAFYMNKARDRYQRWGALKKAEHLEETCANLFANTARSATLLNPLKSQTFQSLSESGLDSLDLFTIIKTSQALSGELLFDKLITKFMRALMENVGAQKGFLISHSSNKLAIEAKCTANADDFFTRMSIPIQESNELSTAIVTYVARTKKNVVINNAVRETTFQGDSYIQQNPPKSVICVPIVHKNRLNGIIYLENNLVTGAFTDQRLDMLKILTSQIAISLENAQLYENLRIAEEKYRGIFENAVEGIYRCTFTGKFISANPAMARILGYDSPEELISSITDIVQELYVDPERRTDFINMIMQEQAASDFEVEFFRKDGSTFWASLHSRTIFDDYRNPLYIEGILTDITEKKMAMDALRKSEKHLRKEIGILKSYKDRYKLGRIVGKSIEMQDVYELIAQASATDATVIIEGESGTGKELVAEAIHGMSDRKEAKFVAVNCGAIPQNLFESEFFGYKKGVFTGADSNKHGYLHSVNRGTLFLDELGEVGQSMQVKLLRVIESGNYMPVGDIREKHSDFRLIGATNRNLQDLVKQGDMREDFFYRTSVIPIKLPPLRERREDIPLLVEHFWTLHGYAEKRPQVPAEILETLMNYDWPGNVRELQNTLHRYATINRLDLLGAPSSKSLLKMPTTISELKESQLNLREATADFEKEYLKEMLKQNQWHRTRVASLLGIGRRTLFRKMMNYGLNKSQDGE